MLVPTLDEIAHAISKRDKARIIPTGVQALNKLGLSTQVPLNAVYLTDGTSRSVRIANGSIKFKKASPKMLSIKSETILLIIQGMRELGEKNLDEKALQRIAEILKEMDKTSLEYDLKIAPVWISKIIKNIIDDHEMV